jgi:hypothetical protein
MIAARRSALMVPSFQFLRVREKHHIRWGQKRQRGSGAAFGKNIKAPNVGFRLGRKAHPGPRLPDGIAETGRPQADRSTN